MIAEMMRKRRYLVTPADSVDGDLKIASIPMYREAKHYGELSGVTILTTKSPEPMVGWVCFSHDQALSERR
jgi:hypothetical protein